MHTLRGSFTSPYVRKVRALAIEAGLTDRLRFQETDPWAPGTDLVRDNPLSKVPVLITADGSSLFDSRVICEYLDADAGGTPLFPAAGPARWQALRQQAIADGLLDAAVLRLLEGRRPEDERSAAWQERQKAAVTRALDLLEREAGALDGDVTIGRLAVAVALAYLDFRFGHENWREGRPELTGWHKLMMMRPSLVDTARPAA